MGGPGVPMLTGFEASRLSSSCGCAFSITAALAQKRPAFYRSLALAALFLSPLSPLLPHLCCRLHPHACRIRWATDRERAAPLTPCTLPTSVAPRSRQPPLVCVRLHRNLAIERWAKYKEDYHLRFRFTGRRVFDIALWGFVVPFGIYTLIKSDQIKADETAGRKGTKFL
uniref:Complex I-B15 n=1 Tax=Haptolina brevifila TaxID=156173 RepID=A0A7S2JJF0_9EUKA|mmetsp:Transcript_84059/g.167769  ORF Transcript_84059/g.167769 Transcript_84059/m.167769 type:complete len:170 (+) Transcript_84059:38-547(+)